MKCQCPVEQVQEMRDQIPCEEWNTDKHLPEGWNGNIWERDNWGEDKTVPAGWKKRVHGCSGKEYILRQDGKELFTRCLALQHMMDKEDVSSKDIMEMRSKFTYEGWNEDSYLPTQRK